MSPRQKSERRCCFFRAKLVEFSSSPGEPGQRINVLPIMNRRRFTNLFRILAACSAALVITGCSHYGPPHSAVVIGPPEYYHAVGLTEPTPVYSVVAQCAPPEG